MIKTFQHKGWHTTGLSLGDERWNACFAQPTRRSFKGKGLATTQGDLNLFRHNNGLLTVRTEDSAKAGGARLSS
jgi:hypothetical protein